MHDNPEKTVLEQPGRLGFCVRPSKNRRQKKRSERRKHCARAGCSKVRTPPALPSARPLSQTHRQDRLRYTACAAAIASAQCNENEMISGFVNATKVTRIDGLAVIMRHPENARYDCIVKQNHLLLLLLLLPPKSRKEKFRDCLTRCYVKQWRAGIILLLLAPYRRKHDRELEDNTVLE